MSYCTIIAFQDGKPSESKEFQNAWGGAAYIWDSRWKAYEKNPNKEYDTWLCNDEGAKRLWALAKRKDLPRFMRAVHVATFDRAIVKREHYLWFIKDLRDFTAHFPTTGECHLYEWAKWIVGHSATEAIGFHHTSVSENLWDVRDDEATVDEDDIQMRPYDLNVDVGHFDVYEAITEYDQEQVTEGTR